MSGRIVACGLAAFVLIMPVASNGETNPAANDGTPPGGATILLETIDGRTQTHVEAPAPAGAPDQTAATTILLETIDGRTEAHTEAPAQDQPADPPPQPQSRNDTALQKVAALDPAVPPEPAPAAAARILRPPIVAEPFGLNVMPVAAGGLLTKWTGVQAQIRAESDILSQCRTNAAGCPTAARNFLSIVAQGRAQTGRARIGIINRAVNLAIRPMSDMAQWGVIDRWSPPLETFTTGAGDCEDYAIAKYVALTEAGVAAADLRLIIVHNLAVNEEHAVVAARLDNDWIILDNRWLRMVNDSEMSEVTPLFALDQTGVWQFTTPIPPTPADALRASAPPDRTATAPGSVAF
jgi:predicted transglutaminase-like cysteine proteinase